MKYSTNELEMLGIVWETKHFKNYLYGSEFEIVTDHEALKIDIYRVKRGIHRSTVEDTFGKALRSSHNDNEFVVATINNITDNLCANTMCTKKNCEKNNTSLKNPVEAKIVYKITKLDNKNQTVGIKERLLLIKQSLFANIRNYFTETIKICNTNHSQLESCTNSCIWL